MKKEARHESNTSKKYLDYWPKILDKIKQDGRMTMYANLIGTKGVLVNDMMVGIEFPNKISSFARNVIEDHDNKSLIEKAISMEQGSPMQVIIIDKNNIAEEPKKEGIEKLATEMELPFQVIDE